MAIGAFSVSLNVEDIEASLVFYQKLGFSEFAGDKGQGWLILKNDDCIIGLFQGMLPRNTLTFNPGWNQNAETVEPFTDIRAFQDQLQQQGVEIQNPVDPQSSGPASFMVIDPDGNPILIDQHV